MSEEDNKKPVGRLKSRSQFLVVRNGERRKGPLFLLEVLNRNDVTLIPRIGFTVTKKQGDAVRRNRIRRRLKEAVRLSAKKILKPGHDYVIIAKRDVLFASFEDLCTHFIERVN
ncbi:Ribonuclease P protein component [Liberibacter crescens BT-1]|uniref:Ribonuclease P protein component n=1 Tax=Liberibacter crescens (strain BT-1) TaxID=1215343 RepID=L0EWH3_LIBCB|nr:ribonuclease P protein component [Liberibacter crescens]AGA65312.1 Ribonuclease P protein component [Liberibacter crescens BT-1]AMC13242.1 ribonuclease P [Liberibacter crescens]